MPEPSPPFHTITGLPQQRELAALLGDLTVAWSNAERVLFFLFWVASGTSQPKAFDIYETTSGMHQRLELTLRLFQQQEHQHARFPEIVGKLRELVECGRLRNEFIHRTWISDAHGSLFLLEHRMKKGTPSAVAVDEEALKQLLRRIASVTDTVLPLMVEIYPDAFTADEFGRSPAGR